MSDLFRALYDLDLRSSGNTPKATPEVKPTEPVAPEPPKPKLTHAERCALLVSVCLSVQGSYVS